MSEALLAHATRTISAGSSSFATAARLFPAGVRRSVLMLYAWCRHCDDVVDGQVLGFGATHQQHQQAAWNLITLMEQTRRAYAGEAATDPAFAAFQEVALRHQIPPQYAFDHLAGFAMDVQDTHYETIDDTMQYCYRVAGVVGPMMARIMGVTAPAALDRACDLGLAFQLTNIARDLVEDAAVARCYLPKRWLQEAGLSASDLHLPRHRAALATLAARLVAQAEPYYASARAGLTALPLRSAWAIATAHGVYRRIGIEVRARGARAWDERVSTSGTRKLWLLAMGAASALISRYRSVPVRPAGLWQRPVPDPAELRHATDAGAA